MKNLLKYISYKKKYGKVAGQLIELRAERDELKEKIRELNIENISLELEIKKQMGIAENTRAAAIQIEERNRYLEGRNRELRGENIQLKLKAAAIEVKEVESCDSGTQSNGC
jgi:predicted nuclease with TOPRIM domain